MIPAVPSTVPTPVEPRLREILGGVAAFRVLALVWAIAVSTIDIGTGVIGNPLLTVGILAVMAMWTGLTGMWAISGAARLVRRPMVALDIALGGLVVAMDSVVYDGPHAQSFGSAWPLAAVIGAGAVLGWSVGVAAGAGIGMVNIVAALVTDEAGGRGMALLGTLVLMATAGGVAGWVTDRLRRSDSEVAEARAREEFARTLHDGVLQTLAVIQRRSDDGTLVELAREQEWELRDFIGRDRPAAHDDLLSGLRSVAARAERHHSVRVALVVIDTPDVTTGAVEALVGATTEAVTNAVKHGGAGMVTICVDSVDRGCSVTINDDGSGFDVATTAEGSGVTHSIRARVTEVGGRVGLQSRQGRGTEVTLWVP